MRAGLLAVAGLAAALALHLRAAGAPRPETILRLAAGAAPESFEEVLFAQALAPRAVMAALVGAALVGAALGLAGSVLQQVTRNRLVSPLTLGASSGAWLALVAGTILAPAFAAAHGFWLAFVGAVAAAGAAPGVAGRRGAAGLGAVLAGMALNLMLGAMAALLALLHGEAVRGLFIWGAGDLAQNGWQSAAALASQLAAAAALALLCRRPLALMRVGAEAAAGRGLAVAGFAAAAVLAALWMTASAVAAVGLIGFIGLIAPSVARLCGARGAGAEAMAAAGCGALALLLADALILLAGGVSRDLAPTGASAALIGAPALILLARGRVRAQDQAGFRPPGARARPPRGLLSGLLAGALALVAAALFAGPTEVGWRLAWPDSFAVSLRWPRVLASAAAGAGMALSGAILQRLLRNPLASPDIIGISSGASLALVAALAVFGVPVREAGAPVALLGGLGAAGLLVLLGRRLRQAPVFVALAGVSLAATLDAAPQFVLASGGEEAYMVLGWLAGSTLRATGAEAGALLAAAVGGGALALFLRRWLTLLSLGDDMAAGRGLAVEGARLALLLLAAGLAAGVTALVGPVAFVGLAAPHLATLLGARRAGEQLLAASLIGICLFVAADWGARTLLHPDQLPSGAVASAPGGVYLALLLARGGGRLERAGISAARS